ncbi:hypothetical protein Leryth_027493 [Lithospermum erythrorhizon]|nr:hypothetical protein Leryth_027493 [Lithospermum erythrorhizon]
MDVSEDSKVSPRRRENLKVEPGELLEEGWFFGNLLDSKIRVMSRCFSDPCPSSKKPIPSTIPKQQYPRMKPEQEGSIQRSRQQILKQTQNKTSFANVETEQVKNFEGSCNDIPTKEIKTLPKLPEEAMMEEDEDKDFDQIIKVRKPYVQGARRLGWTVSALPVLDNIDLPRTADNMKAQIKFWARSVASNVR